MTLQYRSVLSLKDPADVEAQRDLFQSWLESCGVGLQLPEEPGTEEDRENPRLRVTYAHFDNGELQAQRFESSVPSDESVVTTSLTTVSEHDRSTNTLWLEQDHAFRDPVAPPIRYVDVPTLVGVVLSHVECLVGGLPVLAEPQAVAEGEVGDLIDILKQPERDLPLVLVQPSKNENVDDLVERCGKLQQRVSGLASILVVDHAVAVQLNAAVGADFEVAPGVVRVFMPGFASPADNPQIHLSIPGFVFKRQPGNAAVRLQRPLIREALKRHLPDAFGQVSSQRGFPNHVEGSDEELVTEIIDKDTAIETLEKEVATRLDDFELTVLELDEATARLDDFRNRIRYLEHALKEAGEHDVVNAPTPPSAILSRAESCVQAVTVARVHLTNLEIADSDYLVEELDSYAKSSIWARKAWLAFVALHEFAQMKLDGDFDGDFWSFCSDGDHPDSLQTNWVAMQESESTSSNPALRAHRTFPIYQDGEEVDVFMCAHIKLQLGGSPAPRIHFYDDCVGPSQKIHIGYFGKHLPL
ncbi:MAG: hypothetical protein HN750_20250 [Gemmatimonadales bacterium]|jgi:hypothetical protein|nr:hypothetical protein [Gemmatimonadales bacterium]